MESSRIFQGATKSKSATSISRNDRKHPFFQPKLVVGPIDDPLEREADTVADKVMRMAEPHDIQTSRLSETVLRKCKECEHEEKHVQRQHAGGDDDATPDISMSISEPLRLSTGPDFLSMRRPFFDRRVPHLWDSESALRVWNYNFQFFRNFGLAPSVSITLSNITAPRAIDSQLRAGNPTWWEITDRELNTSSITGSIPVLEFGADFRPVAPGWVRSILGGRGNAIQRKCAHCEEEERERIQRKEENSNGDSKAADLVSGVLESSGTPFDGEPKKFMENRFGHNFSDVRIHADTVAAKSAQSINAKAYTSGNNIVFNKGQYSPSEHEGRRLLAHELTHVIQQGGGRANVVQREGESRYLDTVASHSFDKATSIYSGTVDRAHILPARGTRAQQTFSTITGVRINFDAANCRVVLPMKIKFEHPNATNWPFCGGDSGSAIPKTPLSSTAFDTLKARILRLGRSWFTDLYRVNLPSGCSSCAGQTVDVTANIEEVTSGETTVGVLANKPGRSCGDPFRIVFHNTTSNGEGIKDDRIVHELGHSIIGYSDEYPVKRGNRNPGAVHSSDFSMAGESSAFRDWMILHDRHFTFVTSFLDTILNCKTSLRSASRLDSNSTISGMLGFSDFLDGSMTAQLGYDWNIPFDRMRRLQLTIGAHAHIFEPLTSNDRTTFLAGLRTGLELNTNPSRRGARLSLYGEGGMGSFGLPVTSDPAAPTRQRSPYLLGGGTLGYRSGPEEGRMWSLSAEFGVGTTLRDQSAPGAVPNSQWWYGGLNFGYHFR